MSKGFLLWYNALTSLTSPAKLHQHKHFFCCNHIHTTSTCNNNAKVSFCINALPAEVSKPEAQSPARKRYNYILVGSAYLMPTTPYQRMIAAEKITKRTGVWNTTSGAVIRLTAGDSKQASLPREGVREIFPKALLMPYIWSYPPHHNLRIVFWQDDRQMENNLTSLSVGCFGIVLEARILTTTKSEGLAEPPCLLNEVT